MLYTKKGDDGSTILFDAKKRVSKTSVIVEVLGAVDELNSLLGICKVNSDISGNKISLPTGEPLYEVIEELQQDLFIAQAELAGAAPKIAEEKVKRLEVIINNIEKELPPIKNFFVTGGTELSALLDYARAVSRRVERIAVKLFDDGAIAKDLYSYLNRISSLLYALARLSSQKSGIKEVHPHY